MFLRSGAILYWLICTLAGSCVVVVPCVAQQGNLYRPSEDARHKEFSVGPFKSDKKNIEQRLRKADSLLGSYPDSAQKLAEIAYLDSRQIEFSEGMAHALNILGLYCQNQGWYDSAITLFQKAIPIAAGGGYKVHKLYINMANSHFYKSNYERALELFYKSLSAAAQYKLKISSLDSTIIYSNMANIWGRLGEMHQAKEALHTVEKVAMGSKDDILKLNFYRIAGTVYYNKSQQQSEAYYKKALGIAVKNNWVHAVIPILNGLSHIYIDYGWTDSAWLYTQKAVSLLDQYPNAYNYDRFHTEDNMGHILMQQKDYIAAESVLKSTFSRAQGAQLQDFILHMEPNLSKLYAIRGKYREAYEHMLHYAELKDSIMDMQKANSLDIWMKARINEKDKQLMAKQLHISQQKAQLQAKNFWIGGASLGAILILGLLILSLRSYRHKQKLQHATIHQMQQEQEINQLKAQVRGEEQERNRIAQELHDGIASQLWAIKLNVDSLQQQNVWNGSQQQSLQTIYRQLDDTTHDVRKTAHNLMPDLLLEEGLATALASLCEKTGKSTGMEVDFLEYGTMPRLDADIELSLYRMIQELIQNVLKHAGSATQLLVQLSCIDMLLNITVEDNGRGFNPEDQDMGFGLQQMKKRVGSMQGHIDVQSKQGRGTTVYLEFDMQHLL